MTRYINGANTKKRSGGRASGGAEASMSRTNGTRKISELSAISTAKTLAFW
jgi:hypothetical protein